MPFLFRVRRCPPSPFQQAPVLGWLVLFVLSLLIAWSGRDVLSKEIWLLFWIAQMVALVADLVYSSVKKKNAIASPLVVPLACLGMIGLAGFDTAYRIEQIRVEWPQFQAEKSGKYRSVAEQPAWCGVVEQLKKVDEKYIKLEISLVDDRKEYDGKILHLTLQKPLGEKETSKSAKQSHSSDRDLEKQLVPGNLIALRADVEAAYEGGNPSAFDYATYLLQQGVSGTAFVRRDAWVVKPQQDSQVSLSHQFLRLRAHLIEKYARYFNAEQTSILAALTLGDKTRLQAETRALFAETGTSHILALSGLHLSILFSLLQFLFISRLRFFSHRVLCQTLLVLSLWLFVYLAGAPISLQRAAWMLTFMQVSHLLSRHKVQTYSTLGISALILLLFNPLILFDVSFQLSFAAVFSIVTFNQYLWRRFPLPKYKPSPMRLKMDKAAGRVSNAQRLRNALNNYLYRPFVYYLYPFLTVSLGAQIGTAPLIAHYFHLLSPLGLVANILVVPAAYILLLGALLFFLLPLTLLRTILAALMQQVMEIMTAELSYLTSLPFATIPVYLDWPLLLLLTVLPVYLYVLNEIKRTHLRRPLLFLLPVVILLGISGEILWRRHVSIPPQITLYRLPRTSLLHLVAPGGSSYLISPQPFDSLRTQIEVLEKNYFRPRHLPRPQWVGQQHCQRGGLLRQGPCILFQGKQILYLTAPFRPPQREAPLPIDHLILSAACTTAPEAILSQVRPRQIILDPTVPYRLRRQWEKASAAHRIPCHITSEQGYYQQILPQ